MNRRNRVKVLTKSGKCVFICNVNKGDIGKLSEYAGYDERGNRIVIEAKNIKEILGEREVPAYVW